MTFNIHEHMAGPGLRQSIEGNFANIVRLTGPDGIQRSYEGQVVHDTETFNLDTGEVSVINRTEITLVISSLVLIPKAGEKWFIEYPMDFSTPEVLTKSVLNTDKAPELGQSIGFITLLPQEAVQK